MNFELLNSSQQLRLKKLIINPEDAKPKENDAEAEKEEETTPTVVDLTATVETPSLEILARQNIKFVVRNSITAYNPTILVKTNDNFVWGTSGTSGVNGSSGANGASGASGTANSSGVDNTSGATNSSGNSSNWWEIDKPEIPNMDTNVDFPSIEQLKSYVLNGNARNDFEAKFNDVPYNIGEAALLITKHENDFSSLTKDQFLNELHEILINKNVSEMTEDEIKNKVENLSKNINDLFTKLKNGEKIDDQAYKDIYNDIVKLKDKDLSNVGEFRLQYFELQKLISQFNHEFVNQNLNEEQSLSLLKNSLTKLAQQENFDGRMSSAIFELPNVFNNILLDSIIENIPEDKVYTANEFDSYLSSMNDTISANLKNKGFSDEQIELILELARKNAIPKSNNRFGFNNTSTQTESLKSVIQNYVDNIEQLTNPVSFKLIISGRYEQTDVWESGVGSNSILAQLNMYINSDNIQLQYFGSIIKNSIEDLNLTDNQAAAFIQKFIDNIIKSAGLDHWTTANSIHHYGYNGNDISTMSESEKALASRYDFIENYLSNDVINALGNNPLAKLSQILNNTMADIKVVDNNATTIDIDSLFGNEQELSADYILENLDSLLLSNDGGVRQFAEIFANIKEDSSMTIEDKKHFIQSIIYNLNQKYCITNPNPVNLSIDTINKLNLTNNTIDIINEVANAINNNELPMAYISQVNNEFYVGDPYFVLINGDNITINQTIMPYKSFEIDLNYLCSNLSENDKAKFKEELLKMPAEVILDIYIEIGNKYYSKSPNGTGGIYQPDKDNIKLNNIGKETITHETGHALSYNYSNGSNQFMAGFMGNFKNMFKQELNNYIKDGNTKGGGHWNEYGDYINDTTDPFGSNYCTTNADECFAEIYTLLMYGTGRMYSVITDYFPNCLNMVKEYLEFIRQLPVDHRKH